MFSPGDRVECINEAHGTPLVKGIYTVERVTAEYLFVKELIGGWALERFAPKYRSCFILDEVP